MNVTRWFVLSAILAIVSGCTPKRFPGTDILDTPETRRLLELIHEYQAAVNAKDAEAVLKLVSPKFLDEGGTPDPADDLDFETLKKVLPERFAQMEKVKLQIDPRDVKIENDRGTVTYYYTINYRLPKLTREPQMESEIKQMVFVRDGEEWKILSGI